MKFISLPTLAGGVFVAVVCLSSLHAQTPAADGPKGHGPSIEERLAKMKENLALSDDQVAKLKTIFEEQKAKIDPIFQDASLSREQKSEKARPIKDETKGKVDAVLTPEQKTKLEQIRAARKAQKKGE